MLLNNLTDKVLFEPLRAGADELSILSAYATPNMLSWYITNIGQRTNVPIKMPFDDLSVSIHEGFLLLLSTELPREVESIKCSYVIDNPAEHGNLYIWSREGVPQTAFAGSASFVQSSFIGAHRQETMVACPADEAMDYFNFVVPRTVYCNHAEIEEYIILHDCRRLFEAQKN